MILWDPFSVMYFFGIPVFESDRILAITLAAKEIDRRFHLLLRNKTLANLRAEYGDLIHKTVCVCMVSEWSTNVDLLRIVTRIHRMICAQRVILEYTVNI